MGVGETAYKNKKAFGHHRECPQSSNTKHLVVTYKTHF